MFGVFSWKFPSEWVVASQHALGDEIPLHSSFSLGFNMVLNYLFHLLTTKWLLCSSVGVEGDCLSACFDKNWKPWAQFMGWIRAMRSGSETSPSHRRDLWSLCSSICSKMMCKERGKVRLQAQTWFAVIKAKAAYWKLQKELELMWVHKM